MPSFSKHNKYEKNNIDLDLSEDTSEKSTNKDNPDRITRRIQEAVHKKNLKK